MVRARLTAVTFGLAAALTGLACSGREQLIAPGQPIHHDDFAYLVDGVERRQDIGSHRTDGTFLLVLFTVQNHAKRVNHTWSSDIAYVVDAEGRQYENSRPLQEALARTSPFDTIEPHVTPPGQTETTTLVFELPAGAGQPKLGVRGSFLMGDLFDGDQFARVRVKLY